MTLLHLIRDFGLRRGIALWLVPEFEVPIPLLESYLNRRLRAYVKQREKTENADTWTA